VRACWLLFHRPGSSFVNWSRGSSSTGIISGSKGRFAEPVFSSHDSWRTWACTARRPCWHDSQHRSQRMGQAGGYGVSIWTSLKSGTIHTVFSVGEESIQLADATRSWLGRDWNPWTRARSARHVAADQHPLEMSLQMFSYSLPSHTKVSLNFGDGAPNRGLPGIVGLKGSSQQIICFPALGVGLQRSPRVHAAGRAREAAD
jgi:hypothetical protein